MYSRQESARTRKEFWTTLGQYMLPISSSDGEKLNWINYRTGEKDIFFRMHADTKKASIGIELTHKDSGIQQLYFEQFLQFKSLLHQELGEEWTWQLHIYDEHGKIMSRIVKELPGINIMNRNDWPILISFFKPRIIALDEFWNSVKYGFEALR